MSFGPSPHELLIGKSIKWNEQAMGVYKTYSKEAETKVAVAIMIVSVLIGINKVPRIL